MNPEDLRHSRLVVLWGTNTLTSNRHLWPFVEEARTRGAEVVVIDPFRTRTAARADHHIAPLPGTDGALALGLAAELVRLGAHDEYYLSTHTTGWDEFWDAELSHWDAERAAAACDIPVATIRDLAERIARSRPTGIRTLMGMQRHAGGGQAARALTILPAITGDFARLGGGICYSTSAAYGVDHAAFVRKDLRPHRVRNLAQTHLGPNLVDLDDPPVKGLMIWAANPMVSNPDIEKVRTGLSREDLFTVVVEHVHTDTTAYADIVLPGTTQLEHKELQESYTHLYLHWNEPAVEPRGEARSHTEIFRGLAAAMGFDDPLLLASDDELATALLSGDHPSVAGITLDALKATGWCRLSLPDPCLPVADGFPTSTGTFEFSSQKALDDGHGEFPHFVPAAEGASPGDGLALVSPANHHLINSTFAGSAQHSKAGPPLITVHPDDAIRFGAEDGDLVLVRSERGAFEATMIVSADARPRVAHTTKGNTAVNATTSVVDADMGRGARYHDNRVWLEPIGRV